MSSELVLALWRGTPRLAAEGGPGGSARPFRWGYRDGARVRETSSSRVSLTLRCPGPLGDPPGRLCLFVVKMLGELLDPSLPQFLLAKKDCFFPSGVLVKY